ncbi:MAG: response regulator [Desulfobacteraceae bacterium]|nr:response regulator [Desulfobacteraceae bacterium]
MTTEKVLLVDDEVDFLETMAERLQTRGMDVTTVDKADEAFEKIQAEDYDAVILDFLMPGMNGIEALKALKKKRPDLQVILLTGHATIEKSVEAMKLGAVDFLEKPADIEALTEKIKEAQTNKMLIVEKKMESRIKDVLKKHGV